MARSFNGSSQTIDYNVSTSFDNLSTFSGHAWVYPDSTADGALFSNNMSGTPARFSLIKYLAGFYTARERSYLIFVSDGTTDAVIEGATDALSTSTWQPVGFSFLGNDSNGLRLYIDGSEDANSPVTTSSINDTGDVNSVLDVGAWLNNDASKFLDGDLAELCCWNVVLTDAEFAALGAGASPLQIRPHAIIFYAPLEREATELFFNRSQAANSSATSPAHPPVYRGVPPFIPLFTPSASPVAVSISGSLGFSGSLGIRV